MAELSTGVALDMGVFAVALETPLSLGHAFALSKRSDPRCAHVLTVVPGTVVPCFVFPCVALQLSHVHGVSLRFAMDLVEFSLLRVLPNFGGQQRLKHAVAYFVAMESTRFPLHELQLLAFASHDDPGLDA